jgi:hypothetical protein
MLIFKVCLKNIPCMKFSALVDILVFLHLLFIGAQVCNGSLGDPALKKLGAGGGYQLASYKTHTML